MNKKVAVIGIEDGWSSQVLADAVAAQTGSKFLIEMSDVTADLGKGRIYAKDIDLMEMDAVIVKKIAPVYTPEILDRLEILRHLETKGVKVFSPPTTIMQMINRLSCILRLEEAGIPMPKTTVTEDVEEAIKIVKEYGSAVLKPFYTSKARGMKLLTPDDDIEKEVRDFKENNSMMFIQKKVNIPGHDLGVTYIGDKYLATYARVAQEGSWNTTTASGGKYHQYEPSKEVLEIADKARKVFNLEFTCVDIVETEEGPQVFEVSAFGGFRGLLNSCNIEVAPMIVDKILKQL